MKTHTLKTLLEMPVDELLAEVRKIKGIEDCPRCNDPECAYNNYPDIQDLNYWKTEEDGLTDEEKRKYANWLQEILNVHIVGYPIRRDYQKDLVKLAKLISATAHHRAVAFVACKLKL